MKPKAEGCSWETLQALQKAPATSPKIRYRKIGIMFCAPSVLLLDGASEPSLRFLVGF